MRVINARGIEGHWFSFTVEGDAFGEVEPQAGEIAAPLAVRSSLHASNLNSAADLTSEMLVDAEGATILPAGIDVHVHSREPGLTHKETWQSLARAAYRGGVVAVCDMPNTLPPTMTRAAIMEKAALASRSGLDFGIFAGVGASNVATVAELLADPTLPVCGLKVFYGRTTGELMYDDLETLGRSLMAHRAARAAGGRVDFKMLVFHSEDQCTVDCNHQAMASRLQERDNAAFAVHSLIRSSEAAHLSTRTILDWARSYEGPIHIAHVSTPLEIELIAEAKAAGVRVTSEVAPHHLLLSTDDYPRLGPLAKMNPPLRSPEEVEALRRLVVLGQVDLFATDHAPHLLAEKQVEIARSPSGVPGVEFFWPLILDIADRLGMEPSLAVAMASSTPASLFGFERLGRIKRGFQADFVILTDGEFDIRNEEVVSKCGWTPYDGMRLPRGVRATWHRGRRVFHVDSDATTGT